jgi:IgA-specific serine endopeptidase
MDNPENSLIIASRRDLPTFEFNTSAKLASAKALEKAALIGKVTDRDSKITAVRAQLELKVLIAAFEKARVDLKEPILAAGRKLDTLVAAEKLPLEKEFGRVSNIVKEFDDAERRRVAEEERLQRDELERIEREKQAELKRIADEQAAREAEARRIQEEAERKANEARREAERLILEAKNKKQREAAQLAQAQAKKQQEAAEAERLKQEAELSKAAQEAANKAALIEEKSGDAAYSAARPIEATKVAGQRQSTNWNIVVEQPFVLAKFHPDLVDIKPRLGDIKQALNEGREIKGIKAEREYISGVRVPPERKVIDV